MKYVYESLCVRCNQTRYFSVDELPDAIAYLRSQSETQGAGLIATTHIKIGPYPISSELLLSLDEIQQKMPNEVWAAFDVKFDTWKAALEATHEPGWSIVPRDGDSVLS